LLSGALPAVFAALVGVLVGQLPEVVRSGFGSPAGHRSIVGLVSIAVVLVGTELVGGAQEVVSTDLYRRYDGYLLGRVMSAALSGEDLKLFDDPELAASLDRAVRVARYGPGELVSGLSAQWTVRAEWIAVMSRLWQARRADRGVMAGLGCLVLAAHLAVLAPY
jgi:ATP-binding cassette subfamily B protein